MKRTAEEKNLFGVSNLTRSVRLNYYKADTHNLFCKVSKVILEPRGFLKMILG